MRHHDGMLNNDKISIIKEGEDLNEMLVGRLPFSIKRGMKLSMKIYEKKLNFLKILTKMLEISSKNYW